jgi:hypothetical protein
MKTKLASVLGLAVLAASFAFGSSLVYAETEETASAIEVVAVVAETNGVESELSCVLDSAGADICTAAEKFAEIDQPPAAGDTEMSVAEAAPASTIHSVNAIVTEINQTVTIAVPGEDAADSDEPVGTGSITAPPVADPVAMLDANTTIEAPEAPASKAVDVIVAEVVETATVAAAGQETGDCDSPMYTGPTAEPAVTVATKGLQD